MSASLVGSEMCIRDRHTRATKHNTAQQHTRTHSRVLARTQPCLNTQAYHFGEALGDFPRADISDGVQTQRMENVVDAEIY
eukprot:7845272-Alexandrium_andersonii.AAC.1